MVSYFKTISCLVILHYAISSCSSLKGAADNQNRIILSDTTLKLLAGNYKSTSTIARISNRSGLPWDIFDRGYNPIAKFDYIEIKPLESKSLLINYWDSTKLIKSKTFKGKITDGYFTFKRRYLIIPAILVNLFRARSFRIGLLPNGNLITDYKQIGIGTFYVLLPHFDKRKEFAVEYEKISK